MIKIAVTGGRGYMVSLIRSFHHHKYTFIPVSRQDVSLEHPQQVEAYFSALDFDVVLHAAANATTKDCEDMPELTHRVNTESTKVIADVCKRRGKRLIFFGTEQSFNGKTQAGPFNEEDALEAASNYGKQKAEADEYIQNTLQDYVILRLSWMMGMGQPGIKCSPNIIRNVMNAVYNETPTLFTVREIRGMTYAKHLAQQFDKLLALPSGVYHFSNVNTLNTYESAKLIARKLNVSQERIDAYIKPNTERYSDRIRDYRLDNTKIKAHGISLSTFEEDVEECLQDYGWM